MSEFNDLLIGGELDMQVQLPATFQADGVVGTHACLFSKTRLSAQFSTQGMNGQATALLGFLKSVAYTPTIGDLLTVDGTVWKVEEAHDGPVKWELSLISPDE